MPELDNEDHQNNKRGQKLQRREGWSTWFCVTLMVGSSRVSNAPVVGSNRGTGSWVR
jgi:hypothetical protein